MERKVLWPILVIGLALVVVPFAMGMPGKTAAGQRMLNDFQPLMTQSSVNTTADYMDNVFKPLGPLSKQFTAAASNPKMQAQLKPLMPMLQPVMPIFAKVPPGLEWYQPLVTTMQGNVQDFKSVNSLPNFNLFTWFFVVPGILLMLLSGYGLWHEGALAIGRHAHPTPA